MRGRSSATHRQVQSALLLKNPHLDLPHAHSPRLHAIDALNLIGSRREIRAEPDCGALALGDRATKLRTSSPIWMPRRSATLPGSTSATTMRCGWSVDPGRSSNAMPTRSIPSLRSDFITIFLLENPISRSDRKPGSRNGSLCLAVPSGPALSGARSSAFWWFSVRS